MATSKPPTGINAGEQLLQPLTSHWPNSSTWTSSADSLETHRTFGIATTVNGNSTATYMNAAATLSGVTS